LCRNGHAGRRLRQAAAANQFRLGVGRYRDLLNEHLGQHVE
jgi:hypothetical protein